MRFAKGILNCRAVQGMKQLTSWKTGLKTGETEVFALLKTACSTRIPPFTLSFQSWGEVKQHMASSDISPICLVK